MIFFRLNTNFLYVVFFTLLLSCSTEKDAFLNRAYHNTTAKYNGYFNANEIIKEALLQHKENRKENYNQLIPIFQYPDESESKGLYSPMDTAASKCEIVIGRHSMPSEKKRQHRKTEWCKWIDDNWITIGWSQFYKRDYESAMEKFKYIETQYKTEPIYYNAIFWQAKTLIEMEDFITAEELLLELLTKKENLDELEEQKKDEKNSNKKKSKKKYKKKSKKKYKKKSKHKKTYEKENPPNFPDKLENSIYPSLADIYLRTNDNDKSIEMLNKSIELKQKRQFKTRLIFILAQVYHILGNNKASDLYAEVVKRNPDYEMAFYAKINRALAFSGSDSKNIKHQLLKMLKDDKNIDFFDQIYYALADISIREGEKQKGIEYLELSVQSSLSNDYQKTKSFIRLGDIYYAEKKYRKAHYYYDSTMTVIPKDHEQYNSIETKNKNLVELVNNLDIIYENDSILNLCKLPEKEVVQLIKKMIENKKEKQEKEREKQEADVLTLNNNSKMRTPSISGGKIFIWDNNLRGMGFNDFRKIWGDIKLEDNWRRSNKNSIVSDGELVEEKDSIVGKEFSIDYYLDKLPCGDNDEIIDFEIKLMNALYEAGIIYRYKLNDLDEASIKFTRLSDDFLPKEKAVASLYQLYLLYKSQGDYPQANTYKNNILTNFGSSEYAHMIKDPNYLIGKQARLKKQAEEYSKIYKMFKSKSYRELINKINPKLEDSTNSFFCKYSYLNALSYGELYGSSDSIDLFEEALAHTVKNCAGTDVYTSAKLTLDKIRNLQSIAAAESGKSSFIYSSDQPHIFALFFPKKSGNINSGKIKLSDFNKTSFSKSGLKTSSSFLNSTDQLILVKQFKDVDDVMDYYLAFKVNKKSLKDLNKNHDFFVITEKNLASLYIEKNLQEYLEFFKQNYLN